MELNKLKEKTARLFFAIYPSEDESKAFLRWQTNFHELCGGRIMRNDTLHTTLVFLGDVEIHLLEALELAAQEVEGKAFDLIFNSAHYWSHNHIVHAVPSKVPPQLTELLNELEQRLHKHRFNFEKRDYKPHVTLLRNAKWDDSTFPEMPNVVWQVRTFVMLQSEQSESGVNYKVLAKFQLH